MQPMRRCSRVRCSGIIRNLSLTIPPALSLLSSPTKSTLSLSLFNSFSVATASVVRFSLFSSPAFVSPIRCSVRFASTKTARFYMMQLNRVRTECCGSPTRVQLEESLRAVTDTPLCCIQGLDGKTVAHCLSTLLLLEAPRDLPLLHECALWLSVHPNSFSPHLLAQSLYIIMCLEYPDINSVVRAVREQILLSAPDMAPRSLSMLLAVLLASNASIDPASQRCLNLSDQIIETALVALTNSGVTEKLMIVIALGKFSEDPVKCGIFSDVFMTQLLSIVWAGIADAEMSVFSLRDIVGLFSAIHAAPSSIQQVVESKVLKEFTTRVETHPLVSGSAALCMASALKYIVKRKNIFVKELEKKILTLLEAYINTEPLTLDIAAKLLAELTAVKESDILIPPSLLRYLVQAINEGTEKWTADSVNIVLQVFNKREEYKMDAQALITRRIELIQIKCAKNVPVEASEIAALLVEGLVNPYAEIVASAVSSSIDHWSVSNVIVFLRAAAETGGKSTWAIMRDVASKLVHYIEKATAAQVTAVISFYGKARVRNEAFCEAITRRATLLASQLTLQQVSTILSAFAAMEYRNTSLFLDLAPVIIAQASRADAIQSTTLLAAYSKLLVWNFKVIWSLIERVTVIYAELTLTQAITVVVALNRMDVRHESTMQTLLRRVMEYAADDRDISLTESVIILSAFSRSGVGDASFFKKLGRRIVRDQRALTPDELAETLMAFARLKLPQYNIFDDLTLYALAVAPISSLMALSQIAIAYATNGCRHEELFSIIADRIVNQKADVPAVTIASVLSAFATLGIRNDRLFIEAISRVRHVGQYGTPKDISNVVYAYAQVGLWHYKLFLRLADRAVQLRGEFRCDQLSRLLEAYARVNMRYEKLFVEFSPRVQTLAHLLTASELLRIVIAYATVRMPIPQVFKACGDRAIEVVESFTSDDAEKLVSLFNELKMAHEDLSSVFAKKFSLTITAVSEADDEENIREYVDPAVMGSASSYSSGVHPSKEGDDDGCSNKTVSLLKV